MTEKRIWVIGGANIDIIGSATHPLKDYDSNIGYIQESFGGVGRNIAQACAELGQKVNLVTCFGADDYGRLIEENCVRLGIMSDKHPTSSYIAILDDKRDMRIAMSDMSILEEMDEKMLRRALDDMNSDDILVIDSNLNSDYIEYIVDNSPAKIASDPVSAAKIPRLRSVLGRISIFKPNALEAEALTGISIVDKETAKASLQWFRNQGIDEVLITMGEKGILCGTDEGFWNTTHRIVEMASANGGGDAMFGAYLSMRLRGESVRNAIEFAIAAAIHKITGGKAVLSETETEKEAAIKALIKTLDIKEIEL